ncbi:MAG: NADPH-dependent FMN reductase [Saprospiraceae bacterium]
MSKKILAFGASSSIHSINKKFATFAANQIADAAITILDLNDFEMPIYSVDREAASGIPDLAKQFKKHIQDADGIIVSFAEHNGSYTAAYKNIYDWMSRLEGSVWEEKTMILLSTSPGGRGAKTVLEAALSTYSRGNKNVVAHFSLPAFGQNFSVEGGITDSGLLEGFKGQLGVFERAL